MKMPGTEHRQRGATDPKTAILVIVIIVVVAFGLWFLNRDEAPSVEQDPVATREPEPEPPPPAAPDRAEEAPDIPKPVVEEPEQEEEPPPELPPVEESDTFARETLEDLSNAEDYSLWLQTDNLVQKTTTIVDGFARGQVLYKIIPVQPPAEDFQVEKQDDRIYLDEANFDRYDTVIDTLTAIPPPALATAFDKLRPLFEEAYADLGKPADRADNSLIAAIDVALETPDITGPIPLKQESVYYQFADPDLESLPPLQKQLIRIGPENRERVKSYLRRVRSALLLENGE